MIDALQQLHLLRPHWLWALALLPLLAWAMRRRGLHDSPWRKAVDPHLLPHLIDARPGRRGQAIAWLAMLAATLAILALAGPSWEREPQPCCANAATARSVCWCTHRTLTWLRR